MRRGNRRAQTCDRGATESLPAEAPAECGSCPSRQRDPGAAGRATSPPLPRPTEAPLGTTHLHKRRRGSPGAQGAPLGGASGAGPHEEGGAPGRAGQKSEGGAPNGATARLFGGGTSGMRGGASAWGRSHGLCPTLQCVWDALVGWWQLQGSFPRPLGCQRRAPSPGQWPHKLPSSGCRAAFILPASQSS